VGTDWYRILSAISAPTKRPVAGTLVETARSCQAKGQGVIQESALPAQDRRWFIGHPGPSNTATDCPELRLNAGTRNH
jgi:hypothetical protein